VISTTLAATFSGSSTALALQQAHLLQQSAIFQAKPGRLTTRACKLLGEDRHDGSQVLQTIEQVMSILFEQVMSILCYFGLAH